MTGRAARRARKQTTKWMEQLGGLGRTAQRRAMKAMRRATERADAGMTTAGEPFGRLFTTPREAFSAWTSPATIMPPTLRIQTTPARAAGPAMTRGLSLLGGLCLGAAATWLLDPSYGRRRRILLRDRARSVFNQASDVLDKSWRDATHRAQGLVAEARSAIRREEVADEVLVERVRAALGRAATHPSMIETMARQGCVTLRGPILASEVDGLLRALSSVRGVTAIDNQLEPHETAEAVPRLQGNARPRRPRFELMQTSWSPATRMAVGLTGASLASYGLRRGGLLGFGLGTLGALSFLRAATNLEWKRLVGMGAGRRAIDLQKTLTVHAPIDEVYDWFCNLENFPRFMSHITDVRTHDGRSHWVAEGPAGFAAEWDAELVRNQPNELLAWRSVPGSLIQNAGHIRFERADDTSTRVQIQMSYNPPAGALGHFVASLFGKDPKRAMDEDLLRFKSLLEEGKATAHGRRITRDELGMDSAAQRTTTTGTTEAAPRTTLGEPPFDTPPPESTLH